MAHGAVIQLLAKQMESLDSHKCTARSACLREGLDALCTNGVVAQVEQFDFRKRRTCSARLRQADQASIANPITVEPEDFYVVKTRMGAESSKGDDVKILQTFLSSSRLFSTKPSLAL